MELRNTNFDNIMFDSKNNQIYKFIKAKNDDQIKKFDFLSKYIFKFSRDINFIPNINVWERKERNLIIGMNLVPNAITLNKIYEKNLFDRNLFIRYYTFLNYQMPYKFIEKSTKYLPENYILFNKIAYNKTNKLRQNILIDSEKKFWFLPYLNGIDYTNNAFELLDSVSSKTKKLNNQIVLKIKEKAITDRFKKRLELQKNSHEKILKKTYNDLTNTIKDLSQNRIKYSDIKKKLGEKLFNEYFGKK